MPRYFFVITYADHQIDDPDGTLLPADAAAIEYARRIITDLREERRPEAAMWRLIAMNSEATESV
jgi:hypothetical protein